MKTSELTGALLDYWVARAEGKQVRMSAGKGHAFVSLASGGEEIFWPSTSWAEGGAIIERERGMIAPELQGGDRPVIFYASMGTGLNRYQCFGTTHLIAAMRAFVGSRFGAEVTDELSPL